MHHIHCALIRHVTFFAGLEVVVHALASRSHTVKQLVVSVMGHGTLLVLFSGKWSAAGTMQ